MFPKPEKKIIMDFTSTRCHILMLSMQFQGKLMYQTLENDRKPNFGSDFGPFWPKFGPPICFVDFIYTRC